jgi:Tfp pilus assembly PilM family ATPase
LNTTLGIGFSAGNIYFTELINDSGVPKLEHVETAKVDFDFEDDFARHKSSQKDLANISGEIQNYIIRRNIEVKEVSLSIGTSQAFLITLPIDYSEGKQSLNSKIYWELSNFYPENYNEFVINTYRLNNVLPCKNSDDYLIIAVHKNSLEFIKRIFKICGLNIKTVDIDHFSAENAVRKNYSAMLEGKKVLLAGLKRGRVDYGYIDNKKYKYYSYSRYNNDIEFNLSLTRKLNSLFRKEPVSSGVDTIFLYGDDIREDTIEAVRKLDKAPVEIVNPFESIKATDMFLKNDDLRKISYKYASSCGVALRSVDQTNSGS